ncbi:GMC oxidoreductase [Nocardioides gansuensis]|uniref:GMC oxidoreductase n=1 Tax=Nocardioides gansuensis TaxID=2138300 RepID=UPI003CCBEEAE
MPTSVTDPLGRFHHVSNAYCCDQAIFPIVGSVNPVLTGLTLAHRLAQYAAP